MASPRIVIDGYNLIHAMIPNLLSNRPAPQDAPMSAAEVSEWEEFFRQGRQDKRS